jgi:ribosomal protein L24E
VRFGTVDVRPSLAFSPLPPAVQELSLLLSRLRSISVVVAGVVLAAASLVSISGDAHAADSWVITVDDGPSITTKFPDSSIKVRVEDALGNPATSGQVAVIAESWIFGVADVSNNGVAEVIPVNPGLNYLTIGTHTFTARYQESVSEPFSVTQTKGDVNLGLTSVTETAGGTATFGFVITSIGVQLPSGRPDGLVRLLRNGEAVEDDERYNRNVSPFDAGQGAFTDVPLQDAPVTYSIRYEGTSFFNTKTTDTWSKGQPVVTTTSIPTPTTSTTLPSNPVEPEETTTTTAPSGSTTTSTTSTTTSTSTPSTPTVPNATTTTTRPQTPNETPRPEPATPAGYRLVGADGTVRSYGVAGFGDLAGTRLNAAIINGVPTADDNGYWLLGADGGIFTFGNAEFFGSTGSLVLNKPVVGMAPTPTGKGYWLVASDGGVFAFGDAGFHGSTGSMTLNKPIVGMTAAADGEGYRLVASDGGIFSFGSAAFYGSMGGTSLNEPVVGMEAAPDGEGYWLVARDGGIFSFGSATFHGSTGSIRLNQPITGMRATTSGNGYWFVATDGGVFAFGDATFKGSAADIVNKAPIVGMS